MWNVKEMKKFYIFSLFLSIICDLRIMFRANGKRQIQIENSQIRKWAAKHCPKQILIDKTGMNLLIFLKMLEPTVNWDK